MKNKKNEAPKVVLFEKNIPTHYPGINVDIKR